MLSLGSDPLSCIVSAVDKGDLLPLALSCKILKDICKHRRELIAIYPYLGSPCRKAYITDVTSNLGRIKWAIDEMKARHDAKWCELVAMTASIPILQWLRDNDFPFSNSTFEYAAKNDHLDVLQWSYDQFEDSGEWLPFGFRGIIVSAACSHGHLCILKWVQSGLHNDDEFIKEYVGLYDFCEAAEGGHIHILEYFDELGFHLDDYPVYYLPIRHAAAGGQIETLNWLKAKNYPINVGATLNHDDTLYGAPAYNGHMEVMNWLLENNCLLCEGVCHAAAEGGQLDILMWARAKGCPWDDAVCRKATKNGHFHVLKWARENGCPWIKRDCIDRMRRISAGNNAEMIDWIESQPE